MDRKSDQFMKIMGLRPIKEAVLCVKGVHCNISRLCGGEGRYSNLFFFQNWEGEGQRELGLQVIHQSMDHFTVVAELPGLWLEARLPVTLF